MKRLFARLLCLSLVTASAVAFALGPHAHGAGALHLVVENSNLSMEFHSPLANLLGFEHPPKTDAQRAAVKAMTAKLNKPETLFKLPKAASCAAGSVRIDSPLNNVPAAPSESVKTAKKDDDDHNDLTATFRFVCTSMNRLDSIEVAIFGAFPGTKTIKAEVIGLRGQSAVTLNPKRRVIKF